MQYCLQHEIVGLDISRTSVKNALGEVRRSSCNLSNVSFVVADFEFLPFRKQSFDFTLCIKSICHLPTKEDSRMAVKEMCRVTKHKVYIPWWLNRWSLLGIEYSIFLKAFDFWHIQHAQFLQFSGYKEVCQICGDRVTQLSYGSLFDSTWLYNFAPRPIKKLLHKIFEALNGIQRKHQLLLRFSTTFEATLEPGEKPVTMKVDRFHEFF